MGGYLPYTWDLGGHDSYFFLNDESGFDTEENHIGVIAQEIQEVVPYMITPFQKDGTEYLGVNPPAMTYMFVNAFKELHAENESMKVQLARQEAAIMRPEKLAGGVTTADKN